jgi:hypothetical protein
MPNYPSLNGAHPFTSHPHGREKRHGKIGGTGRGLKRSAPPLTLLNWTVPSPRPAEYRPGTVQTGALYCRGCRNHVTRLIKQSAGSPIPWVCDVWCSPASPAREHFISTIHSQE